MKKTGAWLAVYALEQVGVKYTFGIPGVHTTEIYDALNSSTQIQPTLVTHEGSGSFMADAISRTSGSIGTIVVVPAAGVTHAMSGIGEAFLDGIPMLVITGGTRKDTGRSYQLHELDQKKLVAAVTKNAFVIEKHEDIIPTIFEAYDIATSGEPGPVFIEIPAELQLFQAEIDHLPTYQHLSTTSVKQEEKIQSAIEMLKNSEKPGIYLGWGAVDAHEQSIALAELLEAPVATTLQGISSFPANHPLHTGMGFGPCSVPAGEKAFEDCDCLLAVGVRFSELATGSYSLPVPENLIHVDINSDVFDKNYPSKVSITGDASEVFKSILNTFPKEWKSKREMGPLRQLIAEEKKKYKNEWCKNINEKLVSPGNFFKALREKLTDDAFLLTDDGNHTFLAAEQFPVHQARRFVSPTDFNCMGYCVPATIATKLANPEKQVVGIVGDGAFLMTCMEIITASSLNLGAIFCVFHDGELGQISQFQKIPLNRKTCTILGDIKLEGVATATGAAYIDLTNDKEIDRVLDEALKISSKGQPVIVDVRIDYSRKSRLTTGVVKANLARFPLGEKVRFIGRAVKRKVTG